jgi:hypothetical protein
MAVIWIGRETCKISRSGAEPRINPPVVISLDPNSENQILNSWSNIGRILSGSGENGGYKKPRVDTRIPFLARIPQIA